MAVLVGLGSGCVGSESTTGPGSGDGSVDDVWSGDGSGTSDSPTSKGAANGTACTAASACASGFCADGVCCNNACSGTCESCAVTGHVGTCTGYAVNTDPERECLSVSQRDAGAVVVADSGVSDAAVSDAGADAGDAAAEGGDAAAEGGDAGAAPSPADAGSDAPQFNLPDGATSSDLSCAGSCNGMGGSGQGACVYPSSTTSCGSAWCNTAQQSAGFACDSQGGCSIKTTDCGKYACESNACVSSCSATTDCSDTAFCDTSTTPGQCTPKLGDGVACTLPTECQSGACTSKGNTTSAAVCCSSDCTAVPGGTCFQSGHIGECECTRDCGDAGSCVLWYRDSDSDGYGDQTGTIANGRAMVGCSGEAVPSGWSANAQDCDDTTAQVSPAQTAYFGSPDPNNANNPYDYNCDGVIEKQTPEYVGQSCEFCNGSGSPLTCSQSYACGASGDSAGFGCSERSLILCIGFPAPHCTYSNYCSDAPTAAFTSTIACGAFGTETTCGTCSAAGGAAATGLSSVQQTCH